MEVLIDFDLLYKAVSIAVELSRDEVDKKFCEVVDAINEMTTGEDEEKREKGHLACYNAKCLIEASERLAVVIEVFRALHTAKFNNKGVTVKKILVK